MHREIQAEARRTSIIKARARSPPLLAIAPMFHMTDWDSVEGRLLQSERRPSSAPLRDAPDHRVVDIAGNQVSQRRRIREGI